VKVGYEYSIESDSILLLTHFLGQCCASTRIPGLVREHRADKANDDIGNSARTKGCGLKPEEFLEHFLLYYWLNYLFTVSIEYLPL